MVEHLGLEPGHACARRRVRARAPRPCTRRARRSPCTGSTSATASSSSPRRSAPAGATFERLDARAMTFDAEFDAVICLCQGAFGLMTADGHDATVLAGMARALEARGPAGAHRVQRLLRGEALGGRRVRRRHAASTTSAQRSATRPARRSTAELWTGCYTPRELRLLCAAHGLRVDASAASSPAPTRWPRRPPTRRSSCCWRRRISLRRFNRRPGSTLSSGSSLVASLIASSRPRLGT